jgi:hypothetical protein
MKMNMEERIRVGEILIDLLDRETKSLDDPYADELPEFITKAYSIKLRMVRFAMESKMPLEMSRQIVKMDEIIKRLSDLQNKKCY